MAFTNRYLIPLLKNPLYVIALSIIVGYALIVYFRYKRRKDEEEMRRNIRRLRRMSSDPSKLAEEFDDESFEHPTLVQPKYPDDFPHVPFNSCGYSPDIALQKSEEFYHMMNGRRTLRFFSTEPVDKKIVENLIKTAGTSPSGAHTEPWTFVAVKDPKLKEQIREIVEREEESNYVKRMGNQWTTDIKGFRTTWIKEYLTEAPWLILIFRQAYFPLPDGKRRTHYYNEISTAISAGILLSAIQNAGLVTLTSTPMNCGPALRDLLERPSHEKLMLLLPIGFPRKDATVPKLQRKPLEELMVFYD